VPQKRSQKERESRKKGWSTARWGGGENTVESRLVKAKRREVRKVATIVKRLKKNMDEPTASFMNEPKGDSEDAEAASSAWSAQQQETIPAYARARGMEPRKVLQALVTSMEKSLRRGSGSSPSSKPPEAAKGQVRIATSQQGTRNNLKI
jgi:hypothetical protein